MLTDTQVGQFRSDGFLRGGRVLDADQVGVLCAELDRVIREKDVAGVPQPVRVSNLSGSDATPVWQVVNIWQASDPYRELIDLAEIVEEVAQLTEAKELRVWHDQIQYKPAETGGVNMWHQDGPLWRILQPKTQVSAWIALDDVDKTNGCMTMVPGSHQWGDRQAFLNTVDGFGGLPPDLDGLAIEPRLCPVPRGFVHYHDALTWHGSHENHSGRARRAIAIHFMTDQTRYHAADTHIMKQFVTVEGGARLEGEAFPLVWRRAKSEER